MIKTEHRRTYIVSDSDRTILTTLSADEAARAEVRLTLTKINYIRYSPLHEEELIPLDFLLEDPGYFLNLLTNYITLTTEPYNANS